MNEIAMMDDNISLPAYDTEHLATCSTPELGQLLIRNEDRVPRNLLDECARRGDDILDDIAGLLRKDYYWGDDPTPGEWWLLFHDVMILGLMPDERAGELLVNYMQRMDDASDDDLQDWLAGYWPALFRNKPGSVIPALRALGEDRSRDWFMRIEAIDAAVAMAQVRNGQLLDSTLAWAASMAFDDGEDAVLRELVANTLLAFARPEYRPQLEALADLDVIDETGFDRDEIESVYNAGGEEYPWADLTDPWHFYTPEAIEARQYPPDMDEALHDDLFDDEPVETYVRPGPKVGRNDPCPCGSGKKYKKCCMPGSAGAP